jgi:hypothetical protein
MKRAWVIGGMTLALAAAVSDISMAQSVQQAPRGDQSVQQAPRGDQSVQQAPRGDQSVQQAARAAKAGEALKLLQ